MISGLTTVRLPTAATGMQGFQLQLVQHQGSLRGKLVSVLGLVFICYSYVVLSVDFILCLLTGCST